MLRSKPKTGLRKHGRFETLEFKIIGSSVFSLALTRSLSNRISRVFLFHDQNFSTNNSSSSSSFTSVRSIFSRLRNFSPDLWKKEWAIGSSFDWFLTRCSPGSFFRKPPPVVRSLLRLLLLHGYSLLPSPNRADHSSLWTFTQFY